MWFSNICAYMFISRWNLGSEVDGMCEREWGRGQMSDVKLAGTRDAARTTCDVWHLWEYAVASKVVIWAEVLLIIWASSSASLFLLWLRGTLVWLTAAVIICFLSSPKCDWDSAHRTEGVGGEKEHGIKRKTKYPLHGNTPSSSSSSIHSPLPPNASHPHPFPSSFHFCHSLIFLLHEIRFDSKSPQACQMTDNPSQFYH